MGRAQLPALVALLLAGAALAAAAIPGLLASAFGGTGSLLGVVALFVAWILTGLAAGRAVIAASGMLLCGVALGVVLMSIAPQAAAYLIPFAPFGLGLLGGELAIRWGELGLLLPLIVTGPLAAGLIALVVDRPRALRIGATLLLAPSLVIAMTRWAVDDSVVAAAAAGTALAALWALLVGLLTAARPGEETIVSDQSDPDEQPTPTDELPPHGA